MKFKSQKSQKPADKRLLWFIPVALIILAGTGLYLRNRNGNNNELPTETDTADTEKIDLNPATEEDNQAVDSHKERIANEQPQQANQPDARKQVTPTIVDAGQYGDEVEVRAFVSGVYETTGVCTFTFSRDGKTVVRELAGEKDSSYTRCPNLVLPRSEFSDSGAWALTVSYSSPAAQGSTQKKVLIN